MTERAAISWITYADDGPSMGYHGARVICPRCEGFIGLECPVVGCGVALVSTEAEDRERYQQEMAAHEAEVRARRAARRARRAESAQ